MRVPGVLRLNDRLQKYLRIKELIRSRKKEVMTMEYNYSELRKSTEPLTF